MSIVRNPEVRTAIDRALNEGGAAGRWRLDPGRSSVRFHARARWGFLTARGGFTVLAGTGQVTADALIYGSLAIRADSVHTGRAAWDARLRSRTFLDAENHPDLDVTVTAADRIGNGRLLLTGTVRVAERTEQFTAMAEVVLLDDADVRLHAELEVSRSALGLGWNRLGMIRDRVHVHAEVHFTHTGVTQTDADVDEIGLAEVAVTLTEGEPG